MSSLTESSRSYSFLVLSFVSLSLYSATLLLKHLNSFVDYALTVIFKILLASFDGYCIVVDKSGS